MSGTFGFHNHPACLLTHAVLQGIDFGKVSGHIEAHQKFVDVSGNKGRDDFPSLLRCLGEFMEIRSNHLFLLFH